MRPCLGPPSLICFVIINSKYNSQQFTLPPVSNVTPMDDTRIFGNAYDDEDVGAEADLNNLETTINKFDFATVKTPSTPIESNKALVKDEEVEAADVHLYRSMIGSLMYLTASRPDIMFAVCACARDSPFDLEAFSDSDYASANLDRKSKTGEYVTAANLMWNSTICIVKNPVFHSKTKHIEIRHHFIKDSYEKKLIQVIKIHTDHNVADLLTKAFDVSRSPFWNEIEVNAGNSNLMLSALVTAAGLLTTVRHNLVLPVQVNVVRHNLVLPLQVNVAEGDFKNTLIQGFI
ncbi:hypothetical protein Tco_1515629 [Tanacetum coccineum]